jgi:hypothetical protein
MPPWGTAADFSAVPLCQATSGKFFVGAFDTIFRLADAWELFGHFKNPTRHIPTQRRFDENNISDLEFMRRHRFLAPSRADNRLHVGYPEAALADAHTL